MLYFNSDKFDFWTIYDCIKKRYPIGIQRDESKMYSSYPGHQELISIIVENIHEESNFKTRWSDFILNVKHKIQKEIIGTTYGQAPCFSSFIELEKQTTDNLTRIKELYFFVSLVGPFYTIVGQDRNELRIDKKVYWTTNYLVVSPEKEFIEPFNLLAELIEEKFAGFRFVPFDICKQSIEGLEVHYVSPEKLNTIFHALFNDQIDISVRTIGNEYFKADKWIKEGYVDKGGHWVAYPPTQSS